MLFAHNLADIGNIVAGGHEVGQVINLQFVITSWDDCLIASFDGYDMIRTLRFAEILERFVENLAGLAEFDTQHHEGTIVDIPTLAYPRHLQPVGDFFRRQVLRIDQRGDTDAFEESVEFGINVFVVVHLGHRSFGSHCLSHDTGADIQTLVGRHGDIEIGILHTGFFHGGDTRRVIVDGEQVMVARYIQQALLIVVNQHGVLIVSREQLCQMRSDGIGARDDDFHNA